jgi:hypothetical protein
MNSGGVMLSEREKSRVAGSGRRQAPDGLALRVLKRIARRIRVFLNLYAVSRLWYVARQRHWDGGTPTARGERSMERVAAASNASALVERNEHDLH